MKKFISLVFTACLPIFIFAQSRGSIDETLEKIMGPVTSSIESVVFFTVPIGKFSVPFVLIWLIVGGIFFTIYNGFVNITGFKHALDVVRGKYDDPNSEGDISHFQALTTALSGTVGVGNIAGVAIAISLGGPGATFWMIVAGSFWMIVAGSRFKI